MPGVLTNKFGAETSFIAASDRFLLLDAPGGTEKTFVPTAVKRLVKSKQKIILIAASCAVGGQLFDDGHTAHSAFQILIPDHDESTCTAPADSPLAYKIRTNDWQIWN